MFSVWLILELTKTMRDWYSVKLEMYQNAEMHVCD